MVKNTFKLKNIDVETIHKKYGIVQIDNPILFVPDSKNITYFDQSKNTHLCKVNSVDINNKKYLNCYWDTFPIGKNNMPIGCPIAYVPPVGIKEYISSVSKNKYVIRECLSKLMKSGVENLEKNGYYVTDKAFCSFNCALSYIETKKKDALYKESKMLLYKMYREVDKDKDSEISPAGDRDLLIEYGGDLTIETYRENFDNVEYINQGILEMKPVVKIFEEKFKL